MLHRDFQEVADAYDLTYAQLTIAWTIAQSGATHALVGAGNVKQARENAAAGDAELSVDEINHLNQAIRERGLLQHRNRRVATSWRWERDNVGGSI